MILVRNRTGFVELMVRALKRRGIPVAGIDRMQLLEQIAVQDIMAFAAFLLLPEDDLNLAALLKSPLVGLSEEELFALSVDRGPQRLWSRLQDLAPVMPAAARAHDLLRAYLDLAGFATPYELLARMLDGEGGRQRLYRRLIERLEPGGALLLCDLVAPTSETARRAMARLWDDEVRRQSRAMTGSDALYDEFIASEWNLFDHPDPTMDMPDPLPDHLDWLRAAGYVAVDAFWLCAGHAVYGGYRPV